MELGDHFIPLYFIVGCQYPFKNNCVYKTAYVESGTEHQHTCLECSRNRTKTRKLVLNHPQTRYVSRLSQRHQGWMVRCELAYSVSTWVGESICETWKCTKYTV